MARHYVYFGTYSQGEGRGIISGEFEDLTGRLTLLDSIDIENPSYLQIHNDILYGVSETDQFDGKNGGALFAVSLEDNGKMRLLSMEATYGKSPCHLCIQDQFIFVSNYSEGSLSVFNLKEHGVITPCRYSVCHHGKGFNLDRQQHSHVHFATISPQQDYLAVCDLGMDKVFFYPYDSKCGFAINAKWIDCPSGSGPRHLVFSEDGKYLYILTELRNTILAYSYQQGNAVLLEEYSSLPPGFSGVSSAAAIHVSPDGKFVAVSNRGYNSIAVFGVRQDGRLNTPYYIKTESNPRDFRYSPNGEWIISANQSDNSVTVYKAGKNSFVDSVHTVSVPHPVCVVFRDKNKNVNE